MFINRGKGLVQKDPKKIWARVETQERNMVSGRIAAKVIQAATSAFLAREDTNHLVGSSQGFKHVSTIRLLSREDTFG